MYAIILGLTLSIFAPYALMAQAVSVKVDATYAGNQLSKAQRDAIAAAQELNKAGKYVEAEKAAPKNVMKAFYGLSHLRQLMGGKRDSSGHWSGYDVDKKGKLVTDDMDGVLAQVKAIESYCLSARSSGVTVDGAGNSVEYVEKVLASYKAGILKVSKKVVK